MRLIRRKNTTSVGYLTGRLSLMGYDDKMSAIAEALSHDIIASSEIEGVIPQQGRVRDVSYGIQCSGSVLVIPKAKAE